jgi:hypothetical protein
MCTGFNYKASFSSKMLMKLLYFIFEQNYLALKIIFIFKNILFY